MTCTLGVGCDEYGVCYAAAMGKPENCGRPRPAAEHALELDRARGNRLVAARFGKSDMRRVLLNYSRAITQAARRTRQCTHLERRLP